MIEQTLATCNNYLHTGRPNKAIQILEIVKSIDPDNVVIKEIYQYISSTMMGLQRQPDMAKYFGNNWRGEKLDGKSIEVFCDQGMGDTINLLRYLYVMKDRWDVQIVLNNYAFFDQFRELLEPCGSVFELTNETVKCDYHTNIMCLPSLLNNLKVDAHYPTPFESVLFDHYFLQGSSVPETPRMDPIKEVNTTPGKPCVGISWKSKPNKSLADSEVNKLANFCKFQGIHVYALMPGEKSVLEPIENLADTASAIAAMDVVVSVDTVVLHLAGAMGKTTLGLLPKEADPRWSDGETTVWYPSVRLFRQVTDNDWSEPLRKVQDELASLVSLTA